MSRYDVKMNVTYDFNTYFGIMIKNMLSMASHKMGRNSWLSRSSSGALLEHTSDGTLTLDDDGASVITVGAWEERC